MKLSSRFSSTARPRGAKPTPRGKLKPASPTAQQTEQAVIDAVVKEAILQLRQVLDELLAPIRKELGIQKSWRHGNKSMAGLDARIVSIKADSDRQVKSWIANLPPIVRVSLRGAKSAPGANGPLTKQQREMAEFSKGLADLAARFTINEEVPSMTGGDEHDSE